MYKAARRVDEGDIHEDVTGSERQLQWESQRAWERLGVQGASREYHPCGWRRSPCGQLILAVPLQCQHGGCV
jgi:hypothetical protein